MGVLEECELVTERVPHSQRPYSPAVAPWTCLTLAQQVPVWLPSNDRWGSFYKVWWLLS